MWNNKKQQKLFSLMSSLQTYYHFKLDFQKVDQLTGGKCMMYSDGPCVIVGHFYWHGLTFIPAWISNHMPSEMWGEITYPSKWRHLRFSVTNVTQFPPITNFRPFFQHYRNNAGQGPISLTMFPSQFMCDGNSILLSHPNANGVITAAVLSQHERNIDAMRLSGMDGSEGKLKIPWNLNLKKYSVNGPHPFV